MTTPQIRDTRSDGTLLIVVGTVIGVVLLLFTAFGAWGALRDGRETVCFERASTPSGAVWHGESVELEATSTIIPLGVWCTYALEGGGTTVRYADLGTPLIVLGLLSIAGPIVVAARRPKLPDLDSNQEPID